MPFKDLKTNKRFKGKEGVLDEISFPTVFGAELYVLQPGAI